MTFSILKAVYNCLLNNVIVKAPLVPQMIAKRREMKTEKVVFSDIIPAKVIAYNLLAIQVAAKFGHTELVKRLLIKSSSDEIIENYYNALSFAASFKKFKTVEALLSNRIPANIFKTPLQTAAECGDTEKVKALFNHNIPANLVKTTLHLAAENGDYRTFETIFFKILPANIIETALPLASENGHTETVEVLLNNSYPIEIVETALYLAAKMNTRIKLTLFSTTIYLSICSI